MNRIKAQAIFDELAQAYLEAAGQTDEAKEYVRSMRRDHSDQLYEWGHKESRKRQAKNSLDHDIRGNMPR